MWTIEIIYNARNKIILFILLILSIFVFIKHNTNDTKSNKLTHISMTNSHYINKVKSLKETLNRISIYNKYNKSKIFTISFQETDESNSNDPYLDYCETEVILQNRWALGECFEDDICVDCDGLCDEGFKCCQYDPDCFELNFAENIENSE